MKKFWVTLTLPYLTLPYLTLPYLTCLICILHFSNASCAGWYAGAGLGSFFHHHKIATAYVETFPRQTWNYQDKWIDNRTSASFYPRAGWTSQGFEKFHYGFEINAQISPTHKEEIKRFLTSPGAPPREVYSGFNRLGMIAFLGTLSFDWAETFSLNFKIGPAWTSIKHSLMWATNLYSKTCTLPGIMTGVGGEWRAERWKWGIEYFYNQQQPFKSAFERRPQGGGALRTWDTSIRPQSHGLFITTAYCF